MGAPVIAVAALARTRVGRRTVLCALAVLALVVALILTPLIAIPFAVAGSTSGSFAGPKALPVTSGDWAYPLTGPFTKGRGFGYNPVDGCGFCSTDHKGYDMAQGCGSTIHAAGAGRVITAGAYQGYGNAVRIDHGNGLVTLYGHMQWNSLRVQVDDIIGAGTPLGVEGNTGNSFGCHLHFEVQQDGTPNDPAPFLAARGLSLP